MTVYAAATCANVKMAEVVAKMIVGMMKNGVEARGRWPAEAAAMEVVTAAYSLRHTSWR